MLPSSGAARVVIGEGPGHQRDTELVVQAANLKPHLADRQIQFVDLNRDELVRVKLKANYSGLGELWLPRTVLDSEFRRLHAQGEDAPLGGRHAEPEEYVRHRARNEVRMAEESAALARDSRKHSRYLRDSAHPFRDCRRHYRDGR